MEKRTGFLLSYVKYGDNDAIVHFFTEEKGYQSLFLKGLYTKNNKKKALLQPLLKVQFNESGFGSGMGKISNLQLIGNPMEWNVKINSVVFFMSEILNSILRNDQQNLHICNEIDLFLQELNKGNLSSHIQFLVLLTRVFGVHPLVENKGFLNPEKGVFEAFETHAVFSKEVSELWLNILIEDYSVIMTNSQRKAMMDSLMIYYHIHFPEFRTPNSLEILQQLWT